METPNPENGKNGKSAAKAQKTSKTAEAPKLKRFQVFRNDVLELDTTRINQAMELVQTLKDQNVEKVTFKDTKEGETVNHTKDRYSKNYRVKRSS